MTSAYSGPELADEIDFLDAARSAPEAASLQASIPRLLEVHAGAVVLDIGPGTGEDLQAMAAAAPGVFGIGIELHLGLAAKRRRPPHESLCFAARHQGTEVAKVPHKTGTGIPDQHGLRSLCLFSQ